MSSQREIVSLETDKGRLEAECDRAPGLPTDEALAELRRGILEATEGKALEKLKQLLSYVVDEIVVEGRSQITPYFFAPGARIPFPSRRRRERYKNTRLPGPTVSVTARGWSQFATLATSP